ncbi:MAG: hypothetical protein AB1434_00225 [Pseudomonadota bacterium]
MGIVRFFTRLTHNAPRWLRPLAAPHRVARPGKPLAPGAERIRASQAVPASPPATPPAAVAVPRRTPPLRVVRGIEIGMPRGSSGRMVISGRLADVCAELDRLAALEGNPRSLGIG